MNGITLLTVDIVTIAFARAIMQMMLGGLLLYMGIRQFNQGAARWWALGFFVNGLSLFAFSFDVPEAWSIVRNTFNHLSMGVASVFFLMGFWRFGQQPINSWLLIVLMAFPLTSIIAWELLWPNARFRVLCTASGQVLYFIALQQILAQPFRIEYARIYRRLRYVVVIYIIIFVLAYASIAQLLPTTAVTSLDYHRSVFSIASLLFMLTLAVGCLALKFTSLAIRNADLAMHDWLTGLLNRRGFFHEIESNQQVKGGDRKITALLAIDIDRFKKINDAQGHAAGDQVLQYVSERLKLYDSENRIIARMGGEEFLITLFDTSQEDAIKLAEELRQQFAQNRVALSNQQSVRLTISIGVHEVSQQEHIEQSLAHADEALYAAKRQGRNRVILSKTEQKD
ncbi:MAG: diguanylate cyclase [Marinicella pacifica]